MGLPAFDAVRAAVVGTTVAAGTSASAGANLPTLGDGSNPRYVRVLAESGTAYVKFGGASSVAATLNDALVSSAFPTIFSVRGMPFFSVIARSGTPNVNILPLDE